MSKFKVGDKVRRVNNAYSQLRVGDIGVVEVAQTLTGNVRICGDVLSHHPDNLTLVEPAHQGPVRTATTTRKVIEPGRHRYLRVHDDGRCGSVGLDVQSHNFVSAELTDLIADLTAIRDALEDNIPDRDACAKAC